MPRNRLSAAAQGFFDPNGTDRANRHAYNAEIDNAWSYLDMRCAQVDTEFAYMDAPALRGGRAKRRIRSASGESGWSAEGC